MIAAGAGQRVIASLTSHDRHGLLPSASATRAQGEGHSPTDTSACKRPGCFRGDTLCDVTTSPQAGLTR
jgi:hypothetical protein